MQILHSLPPVTNQEGLLHRIANRIRQSLELQEILNAMVLEVQEYLSIDRVKVYQFHPDSSGLVIAESVDSDRLPSLLGLNFQQRISRLMPASFFCGRGSDRWLTSTVLKSDSAC